MSMKPILFNTDMVRAILEGRKTVTRRVVKPQPVMALAYCSMGTHHGKWSYSPVDKENFAIHSGDMKYWTPPCHTGDILYVRETWCRQPSEEYPFVYRASVQTPDAWRGQWRPSIHMPKAAARIFLRVTDVRVERLQNIAVEDAVKDFGLEEFAIRAAGLAQLASILWNTTIRREDRALYGWAANPWVWVIEFERCEKPEVNP